jgi:lipoprotein-releasing system permease protein
MTSTPVAFIACRFFIGRRDGAGGRDQARKALAGAVLSVALSLVPLITVMQVADGMIRGISARYVELGTYHAQAIPYGSLDLAGARDAARASPGVTGAWIETQSVGVVFANGIREGAAIRGVEQGFLSDPATMEYLRVDKGNAELAGTYDALLGSAMADKLDAAPGATVNLITLRRNASGGMVPRITMFTVRGIVSAGYRDLDAQWMFIRQETAARILPAENARSFVGVKAGDPFAHPVAARDALLGRMPAGFSVYSWKEVEMNLFESLASTRTMLLLIMAVTVAVAAVNVSSALTTLVLERGQEIAVLKSLGATPADLAGIFAMGGAAIGGAGAIIGVAGGLLSSLRINEILSIIERVANSIRNVTYMLTGGSAHPAFKVLDPAYYLESIPVLIPYGEMAIVVSLTIILSYLASIGPARRAAALSPLEGLRKR